MFTTWVEEKVSSTSSGGEFEDNDGFWTIMTILFEMMIESTFVNGKMEFDSMDSGIEVILEEEIVVGETILIVAIERGVH